MKIYLPNGFRGRETKERWLEKGEHELEDVLAHYLLANGFALPVAITTLDEEPAAPSIQALRQQYQSKTGKKAFGGWDIDTLLRKLAELDES